MNTADGDPAYNPAVDLADGVEEMWVDGVLMLQRTNVVWRKWDQLKVDGVWMSDFYGGNPDDPRNQPSQTQYKYYDNFVVSTEPITHTGSVTSSTSNGGTSGSSCN